jgi:hypothetical protein
MLCCCVCCSECHAADIWGLKCITSIKFNIVVENIRKSSIFFDCVFDSTIVLLVAWQHSYYFSIEGFLNCLQIKLDWVLFRFVSILFALSIVQIIAAFKNYIIRLSFASFQPFFKEVFYPFWAAQFICTTQPKYFWLITCDSQSWFILFYLFVIVNSTHSLFFTYTFAITFFWFN